MLAATSPDVLLASLNLAALYSAARVAVAYARWHWRHVAAMREDWWRGLGLLPLAVAAAASAGVVERTYYGAARWLRLQDVVDLWQQAVPTLAVNVFMLLAILALLIPYWIAQGLTRRAVIREAAGVLFVCALVFSVALAWLMRTD